MIEVDAETEVRLYGIRTAPMRQETCLRSELNRNSDDPMCVQTLDSIPNTHRFATSPIMTAATSAARGHEMFSSQMMSEILCRNTVQTETRIAGADNEGICLGYPARIAYQWPLILDIGTPKCRMPFAVGFGLVSVTIAATNANPVVGGQLMNASPGQMSDPHTAVRRQ
jgi:hypothetical protein